MSVDVRSYISEALTKTDRRELLRFFQLFARKHGFVGSRYLVLAKEFRPVGWDEAKRSVDFPPEWISQYRNSAYFDIDPILEMARTTHEPFYWRDAAQAPNLSEEQQKFFLDLAEHGFHDGIAIPVYSRPGEMAYFGLAVKRNAANLERTDLLQWQFVCQITHQRYEELLGPSEAPDLTPREAEVIRWIMQGKSNASIAAILGVSTHTVDTLVRRCFRKLGATNRLEASLTAMSRGVGANLPIADPRPPVA